ncbi:uncharacterized protein LOC114471542 [Gouania willdenowi]|uniref:uncharacterized protein LOC114471542 n=1 Tax=Gouania willdenowi TaxID=441366 RepID=UPI001054736E|nr:uncharacterized protein LOC114471542 [Gouania willdenowi]
MLAEGFLRQLCFREERKFVSTSSSENRQTTNCRIDLDATDLRRNSFGLGVKQKDLKSPEVHGPWVVPQHPAALSVPGCPPTLAHNLVSVHCSLLDQYPDLQVADSAHMPNHLLKSSELEFNTYSCFSEGQQEPQADSALSFPDQGYLAMGASANSSLELGRGLEPMSNSVLNGLLEKQLEEVYMQHLTDNLARCHSCLENSLLRGLVPPLQPRSRRPEADSLEASLERGMEDRGHKKSYPSTQNFFPCSSNFSSPMLRISEAVDTHQQ